MKNAINKKRTRTLGYALIILQSILAILLMLQLLGENYSNNWQNYLNDQTSNTIYLNGIAQDKQENVESFLSQTAEHNNLLLVKKSINADSVSQSTINIGVAGNTNSKNLNFSFLNKQLISSSDINNLIKSSNKKATLGLDQGSINELKRIATPPFSSKVVISKLSYLNQKDGSISGQYQIIGSLSNKKFKNILRSLSKISDKSVNDLTSKKSGYATDQGILQLVLLIFNIVINISLFAYFIAYSVRNLKKYGILILLGWSKKDILNKELLPFLLMSISSSLIVGIVAINCFLSSFIFSSIWLKLINTLLALVIIILVTFTFAYLIVFCLPNIDLIKNKFPHKILYVFTCILYLVLSAGLVVTTTALDRPMSSIVNNQKQERQWTKVSRMTILSDMKTGADGDSMIADSNSNFNRSIWKLYNKLANREGVYLVHTNYISKNLMNRTDPNNSLDYSYWNYQISPNYAKKIGLKIKNYLTDAYMGTRLYLLPDTFSKKEKLKVERYIKHRDQEGVSRSDIPTAFVKNRKFKFISYHYNQSFFTWNNSVKESTQTKNPVIYITTPQNMTYVEIGNLYASGLNGYLKFANKKVQEKYLTRRILKKYDLLDNKLQFVPIQDYIDGLQKSLQQTISWFALILILLLFLLVFNLIIFAIIFKTANQERIAVKKFLGYSFGQIYTSLLLFIILINLMSLVTTIFLRSRLGVPVIIISFLIQTLILWLYVTRNEFRQIIRLFKGE